MRKSMHRNLVSVVIATLTTFGSLAQSVTITGSVINAATKEGISSVSVTIKDGSSGTLTDASGNYSLTTTQNLPFTLVFSSVGFNTAELEVTSPGAQGAVELTAVATLGQEIVVSATRTATRILESPVSIERVSTANIREAAVPNYYEGLVNLKGVDLITSSMTFRTVGTRGFNGSGNLRFNQFVDGIDNAAPGLNFSVGNIIGITELDVDNVELIQGASSALYGSGGMNGTMLMTSKSPFKYPGFSFQVKQGINHTDGRQRDAAPYYNWSLRWAKTIGKKFAFKISSEFLSAKDWQAEDYRNLLRNNVFSELKSGDRQSDPNYDGVNIFGDEASASMQAAAIATRFTIISQGGAPIVSAVDALVGGGFTPQQIATVFITDPSLRPYAQYLPFLIPTAPVPNNPYAGTFGSQYVSRTGYREKDLVDYDAYNVKLNGGLYYKLTRNIEASLLAYWGTGTTVYTGADRYAIKNLKMGQYKLELKGKNWFLRAYTIQENSGDAYTATTAAVAVNNAWKENSQWFGEYIGTYGAGRLGIIPGPTPGTFLPAFSDPIAHAAARGVADMGRLIPGTADFQAAFNKAISTPIDSKGTGAKFDDATDMYHYEGQINLTDYIKVAEVLAGANYRKFVLNSHGTIFADTTGTIGIHEVGGYLQVSKWLLNNVLKLTVSGRYDKSQNFEGRFTPRATAIIKVAKDNFIRLSYQQAYRFPSTQDQWINLKTPASILIGGLPDFVTFYNFSSVPAYTAESIVAYRASVATGTPNPTLLQVADFKTVKPEIANSYEVGYRGLLTKQFLVDAYAYYCEYSDFIAREAVGRGQSASSNPLVSLTELASPFTTTNYSFVTNSDNNVKAIGWGLSLDYRFEKGLSLSANLSGDQLNNVPSGLVTFFNTPKFRYNLGISHRNIFRNWGFNAMYRWQDKVYWEGTFGTGNIPSYGTVDAQINYKFPKINSIIKFGASNLLNKYYNSAFGNPAVGGVYYVSFGYNIY